MTIKTYQKFNESNVHEGLSIYFQSIGDEFGLEVEDRQYGGTSKTISLSESVRIKFKDLEQYAKIEEDFRDAYEHLETDYRVNQIIYEFVDIITGPMCRLNKLPSIEYLKEWDKNFFNTWGTDYEDGELYYCLFVTINCNKKP